MSDELIAEAIRFMSFISQNEIKDAFHTAFGSPAPPISARTIGGAVAEWKSPQVQLQCILMSEPNLDKPTLRQYQYYHTYEDSTQAGFKVDYIISQKAVRPNINVETL